MSDAIDRGLDEGVKTVLDLNKGRHAIELWYVYRTDAGLSARTDCVH